MIKKVQCVALLLLAASGTVPIQAQCKHTTETISVPMTSDSWQVVKSSESDAKPDVQFMRHEGFRKGAILVKSGGVTLSGLNFRDGTIEFDIKPIGQDIPGIQFRQQGSQGEANAEEFYVRSFPECRASDDCIQYTPVIHGFMLWNAYPQYQTHAFILDGWNHIKLVISGERMNVYVNRFAEPALVVERLESDAKQGGITFHGPATFANLEVTPGATGGLPAQPAPDPTAADPGYLRAWELGPAMPYRAGFPPSYADMPGSLAEWQRVRAGGFGMVNLNRNFKLELNQPSPLLWLRTTVTSKHEETRRVSMGWLGSVSIFVNGQRITEGKNYYYPESERRHPDGRMSLENGSFVIPLKAGRNEIVIALRAATHDNPHAVNRYGQGIEMRFDDPSGLTLNR